MKPFPLSKKSLVILGIGVLLALIAWVAFMAPTPATAPERGEGQQVSTTTPGTVTTSGAATKRPLAPEPAFVLPNGATKIDDYAYLQDGVVYFKSLIGTTSLAIPKSDAGSFEKLADFATYTGGNVIRDCGAAPLYAFYGDDNQVYFYQVWRAPEFRSSQIEVIVGAKKNSFEVTSPTTATSGNLALNLSYQVATTTCSLVLNKTGE